jgi:disulfide bond formation protein DsbB
MNTQNSQVSPSASLPPQIWLPIFLAWFVALISTLGALFIGEVMGMMPCILCWYQRIAMFPLAVTLGLYVLLAKPQNQQSGLLFASLLLAGAGWLVASFHVGLYWGWISPTLAPCTQGGPSCTQQVLQIMGRFDLPALSWLAFTLILILLGKVFYGVKEHG